ncbi:hypothetical protein PHLCEN_2v8508 [Hermanssonia centrifuga]|uniref:Uncharacterized protein n=1 Tax=Hermanssonia centrifuga TaxID=98765 RepID=A0A2R6NTG7_9APHY|nr:hypothetical protein PHLCEN_2v8508 [Hermanssonia centrifuga]
MPSTSKHKKAPQRIDSSESEQSDDEPVVPLPKRARKKTSKQAEIETRHKQTVEPTEVEDSNELSDLSAESEEEDAIEPRLLGALYKSCKIALSALLASTPIKVLPQSLVWHITTAFNKSIKPGIFIVSQQCRFDFGSWAPSSALTLLRGAQAFT